MIDVFVLIAMLHTYRGNISPHIVTTHPTEQACEDMRRKVIDASYIPYSGNIDGRRLFCVPATVVKP